jgi:Uma2 family endonuclease
MQQVAAPQVHLWTRDEYYIMAEAGLFRDQRVELIEGQVIEMSPMGSHYATSVSLLLRTLEAAFGAAYFVRVQMPLDVGERSEPEPDIAVIAGAIREYAEAHPTTAALIVEVADSSLDYDRSTKTNLYAKSGITDYWIVNLVDRQLEVHRTPVEDASQPSGFGYRDKVILTPYDTISPLALPNINLPVAALLP